jgi:PAS domain-containing protein
VFDKSKPAGDGAIILDANGCCRWASQAVASALGVQPSAMTGDGWKRHLATETMRRIQTTWAESPLKFVYFPYVTLHAHHDDWRTFIRFRPIWSSTDGSLVGYLGLTKKLTLAAAKPAAQVS